MKFVILIVTLLLSPVAQAQIVRPPPRIVRILPESNVRSTLRRSGVIQRDQLPPHAYSPRQGQPYTSIGPLPRPAQEQARRQVEERCVGNGCQGSRIYSAEATRADGQRVVEHGEAQCLTCGARGAAQRSLTVDPPGEIVSQPIVRPSRHGEPPVKPRPRGVERAAEEDAQAALRRQIESGNPPPRTRSATAQGTNTCGRCGGDLRVIGAPELVHEPQVDAQGRPTCAHWRVRTQFCPRCPLDPRTPERREFMGTNRYCPRLQGN